MINYYSSIISYLFLFIKIIHNTKEKLGEYVAVIEVMSGGKAEDFIASIPKGLLNISKYNIKLSTVVIDGNTAQLKAFKKSLKHLSDIMAMI